MSKIEEFRKEIFEISKVHHFAKENYFYCHCLYNPKAKEEFDYIQKSPFFKVLKHSLWRTTVIEVVKLIDAPKKNNKVNIKKVLTKLRPNGYYRVLKFSNKKILDFEAKLLENQISIDHLINIRDKIYAHTDPKFSHDEIDISFKDIDTIFSIIEDFIQIIYHDLFDGGFIFRKYKRERFNVIEILAEEKTNRIQRNLKELLGDKYQPKK